MKDFQIGIIGGTGGMGRWFADFLKDEGYTVNVSGRRSGMVMKEMADCCQVIVVSVPISATTSIIQQVSPYMKKEALLMDLTSLKADPVKAMTQYSHSEVIGCHPLFGPQVKDIEGHHIVLCPARANKWRTWLNDLFEKHGALVTETTPENHDAIMAVVQGLNHLNTVTMGLVLRKTGFKLAELNLLATPIFRNKMEIVEKVFCNNARLYAEILTMNKNIVGIIQYYEETLSQLKDAILKKDTEALVKLMDENTEILFDKR
jgi:prephenate dehydrogenase